MTAQLFFLPYRAAFDGAGATIPGAQVWFTDTGTNTPEPVYSDAALTVQRSNPVVADGVGKFPGGIYMDPAITYRVRIYGKNAVVGVDSPIEEYDPYIPGLFADAPAGPPGSPGEGYPTRVAMAARASPQLKDDVFLTENANRRGKFVVEAASSWTAAIAADTRQAVFVL